MNGLAEVPLQRPTLLQRLTGRAPRSNAFLEIRNRLATTPIASLPAGAFDDVLARYRIPRAHAEPEFEHLYAQVLRHVVRDFDISDQEIAELRHLREVLGLSADQAEAIERDLREDAYRKQLRNAVGDTVLTPEEKQRLATVAERLRLPKALADEIRQEEVTRIYQRVLDAAIVDRRLSREEEAYLDELAKNLEVTVDHDVATLRMLDRFRLLWRIEQGELPEVAPPFPLAAGERCHAAVPARHLDHLRRGDPATASDRTRVRMGKAIEWNLDAPAIAPGEDERWVAHGEGTLAITSDGAVFQGAADTVRIPVASIGTLTVFRDGIRFRPDEPPERLFLVQGDAEILATILGAVLQQSRKIDAP